MEEGRLPKEVMKWCPPGRRNRGRPKLTWAEGIRRNVTYRSYIHFLCGIPEIFKNTVKLLAPTQNMVMFQVYFFTFLLNKRFLRLIILNI
jgi:hypothetical protein